MKTFFSFFSLFLLAGSLFTSKTGFAQEFFDEKPAVPLKGSWYSPQTDDPASLTRSTDPFIVSCIAQINADSIRETIRHMQNYGTRFMLVDNRKEIATWILQKFESYGYTNVKLDSFINYLNWNGIFIDTTWQYNVVCTMTGSSAPEEEYIIGGHYDSFCAPDPFMAAPGANDNASAVAATLETARVMKLMNYQPETTIKFILFGAEELGLFGSRFHAQRARETGEDVRYVLNLDMISNNPDSLKEVKIYKYIYMEWAADLMADVFSRYTDLSIFFPDNPYATGSDSFPFWLWGFPVAYLEEMEFSPNWHILSDTLGNCNFEYCAEIARGACATLMEQQNLPYPQGLAAQSNKENVTLTWKPEGNAHVAGFNLYRSEVSGSGYSLLNTTPLDDSVFIDMTAAAGHGYFYILKTVDDSDQESMPSGEVEGARFGFTDTLLVIAILKGNKTTPDSIVNYYRSVFDTIPYRWFDMNLANQPSLGIFARYQNILWLLNTQEFDAPSDTLGRNIITFFANGGNMMFSGFTPTRYLAGNTGYPAHFDSAYFINQYFKVDSVNRKINSFMYRAYPDENGYDTLNVDTLKSMAPGYPGELYNIEVFTPDTDGNIIYRFDSHYSPTTSQGAMQGKAVGLEYMGTDFKTILLSFPLYYLDTTDARNLLRYIMTYKFSHPTGMPEPEISRQEQSLKIFPNPFMGATTLSFVIGESTDVNLSIYNMQGARISTILNQKLEKGSYSVNYAAGQLPASVYHVVLKTPTSVVLKKMVVIK